MDCWGQHQPSWNLVFANENVKIGLRRKVSSELGALSGREICWENENSSKFSYSSNTGRTHRCQGVLSNLCAFRLNTKWTLGCKKFTRMKICTDSGNFIRLFIMYMPHGGLQFFKALFSKWSCLDLTIALYEEVGSSLWSVFYRQGTLLSQEIKSHAACTGLVTLCGNIFLCFLLGVASFVLLKGMCHKAPGQPLCCICPLWGGDRFFAAAQGVYAHLLPLCPAWRDPRPWGTDAHCWGWSHLVSSLSVKLILSGAWLLCFLGDSDTKMHWEEVLGQKSWWQATDRTY